MGNRDANRPSPHFGVVGNKPGKKVLVLTGRNPILKPNPDYLVSGALRSVPRSVLGGEAVAAIFRRKHPAIVEHQAQGSRMGLDEDVGSGDLSLQIGAFTGMPRVLVVPDIKPRPAIERAASARSASPAWYLRGSGSVALRDRPNRTLLVQPNSGKARPSSAAWQARRPAGLTANQLQDGKTLSVIGFSVHLGLLILPAKS